MGKNRKVLLGMSGGVAEAVKAMPDTDSVYVANNKNKKVLLGMSGGVDSSVSAIMLLKQGYEVAGATMKLNDTENTEKSIQDAKGVCDKLNIPHYVFDLKNEFKCKVINKFIDEYKNAKTPNPCVECNKYLKFGFFYEKAKELGCKYIATGHYAKIEYSERYNRYVLKKSNEIQKDQTYFLYGIPKKVIEQIIFPLQDFNKKEDIRKIAIDNKLEVAEKKESQEICFIPNDDYKTFLQDNKIKQKSGNIVLKTGEVLGKHDGLINYTIGQRKGLGIAYKEPLYIIELNQEKNEVIVGNEKELYSKTLIARELNWLAFDELKQNIECYAKIRYRAKEAKAIVKPQDNGTVEVEFNEPQRAITRGQAIVFYDEDGILLGGGKIDK